MWGRSSTEAFTIAASNNASTAAWTAEGPSARWGRGRRPRASKFTSNDRGRSCPPHGRSHEGTLQQHQENTGKHHNWWPFEPSPLLPIILRWLAMMYFQLQQLAPLRTEQRLCCCGPLHFWGEMLNFKTGFRYHPMRTHFHLVHSNWLSKGGRKLWELLLVTQWKS